MSVGSVNHSVHSLVGRRPSTTDVNQNKKIQNQGKKITNQGKKIDDQAKTIADLKSKIESLEKDKTATGSGGDNGTGGAGSSGGSGNTGATNDGSVQRPSYIPADTWSKMKPEDQANISAQDAMQSTSNANNLAMFALQQKSQDDARNNDTSSNISHINFESQENAVRNISK